MMRVLEVLVEVVDHDGVENPFGERQSHTDLATCGVSLQISVDALMYLC